MSIGPELPVELSLDNEEEQDELDYDEDDIGPDMPTDVVTGRAASRNEASSFGPSLPPGMAGPALPPDMAGPALPPDFDPAQEEEEEAQRIVGPAMPPPAADDKDSRAAKKKKRKRREKEDRKRSEDDSCALFNSYGPAMLPPHLLPDAGDSGEEEEAEGPSKVAKCYGPAMPPPHLLPDDSDEEQEAEGSSDVVKSYGAAMPAEPAADDGATAAAEAGPSTSAVKRYGPAMPPPEGDDSDDDTVGPELPSNLSQTEMDQIYVARLIQMKKMEEENADQHKREEWMTELPEKMRSYGLGARTFSKSGTKDADQSWTLKPGEEKKAKDTTKGKRSKRDKTLEQTAEELNASRTESLMTLHAKKRKDQEKEDASKPKERRPFDRDRDLGIVKCLDPKQHAKQMQERAGVLASRFGHAEAQKFL